MFGSLNQPRTPCDTTPVIMLPLVTALCLLALTSASPIVNADPKPCCMPEVFEGSVTGLQAQYINGAPSIRLTEASIHMDMKNER